MPRQAGRPAPRSERQIHHLRRSRPVPPSSVYRLQEGGTGFSLWAHWIFRRAFLSNVILACVALSARADFDPSHWQFRRAIPANKPAAVASVAIDLPIYQGSRARLNDLRILRDTSETPYVVRTLSGSREEREWKPVLLNKSAVPVTGVQATLDLNSHPAHNRLRIATRQKNFKQRVRIETSDDSRTWAIARDDGYIFDFSQGDRKVSVLSVDYPISTRRFVRLTIFGWSDPDYLDSAWLTDYTSGSGTSDSLATIAASASEDQKTKSTLLVADIGFDGLPHDRLQFAVGPGLFYRSVEIETSRDSKNWTFAGQGVISRTADRENSTVWFSEDWERYLRVRILNQDNPPLVVSRLTLIAYRRVVEFPATIAGQYWLYYGNPDAKQPAYDFAQTRSPEAQPVAFTLGREEANAAYRKPATPAKPWSDQHPAMLYTVLIAAIVIMGFFAVQLLLRQPRA